DLEEEGCIFRSHSDTEVLLYLYKRRGQEMLPLLRGMFAFAIFDSRERTVFLARDRIGVKPLYYFNRAGVFGFASEIKALLAAGQVSPQVNNEAFYHYLSFLTTPAPHTLFEGILKLPAGHCMTVSPSGIVQIERWWTPLNRGTLSLGEHEYIEQIRDLLR